RSESSSRSVATKRWHWSHVSRCNRISLLNASEWNASRSSAVKCLVGHIVGSLVRGRRERSFRVREKGKGKREKGETETDCDDEFADVLRSVADPSCSRP